MSYHHTWEGKKELKGTICNIVFTLLVTQLRKEWPVVKVGTYWRAGVGVTPRFRRVKFTKEEPICKESRKFDFFVPTFLKWCYFDGVPVSIIVYLSSYHHCRKFLSCFAVLWWRGIIRFTDKL